MKRHITFEINGAVVRPWVDPARTLLEVLREDLGLTGTKKGCNEGECGACTVLLNGKAVYACLVLASDADGKRVLTIEGLAQGDQLDPIQEAFIESGAIQCGFCSPGMILSAKALLDENPAPSREEVKSALAGNLCRCTGYQKIISAVQAAGEILREGKKCQTSRS